MAPGTDHNSGGAGLLRVTVGAGPAKNEKRRCWAAADTVLAASVWCTQSAERCPPGAGGQRCADTLCVTCPKALSAARLVRREALSGQLACTLRRAA